MTDDKTPEWHPHIHRALLTFRALGASPYHMNRWIKAGAMMFASGVKMEDAEKLARDSATGRLNEENDR